VHGSSGLMTGVTRDGCFLIKDGKIAKPVKNFRFTESPFLAFNKVEMIGEPERVAFGYDVPREHTDGPTRWPHLPIIVPPMMIQDFNFTALSDAV
jgi:predicted Zn-dependent protease